MKRHIRRAIDVYKLILCLGLLYVGANVFGATDISHGGRAALLAFFAGSALILTLLPTSDGKFASSATSSIQASAVLLTFLAGYQWVLDEAGGLYSYLWLPIIVIFSFAMIGALSNYLWPNE